MLVELKFKLETSGDCLRANQVAEKFRFVFALLIFTPVLLAAQESSTATPQKSVAQEAVQVVMKHNLLDPTVMVSSTNKPLPADGGWAIGKQPPAQCAESSANCVSVFYRAPEGISCSWVIQLNAAGSDGEILDQDENAARYFLRVVSPEKAAALVIDRKTPIYPPIAVAAHVQGLVVVAVVVNTDGTIERFIDKTGPEMLKFAAREAAKGWSLKPLNSGTHAIRYEMALAFDFKTGGPDRGSTVKVSP
jgi:outer membrane biosynthesis protein TonB